MISLSPDELTNVFGFGVAGNFAGHLEQAGEAADFVTVEAVADAPKGIFPWYVPDPAVDAVNESAVNEGADRAGDLSTELTAIPSFLRTFPLSSGSNRFPAGADNLQIEPEMGVLAEVLYAADGSVTALAPVAVAAFNDCSIRRPGAKKISEKKNWGAASKGLAARGFAIDDLSATGPTAGFRLASFLVRAGETHAYGVDSAVPDYSYYGAQLLDWIVDRLVHQLGSDDTPLEPVGAYLRGSGSPARVLIGIGATRYTPFGASTYLKLGDDAVVVVYDSGVHSPDQVAAAVAAGTDGQLVAASVLRQRVIAA